MPLPGFNFGPNFKHSGPSYFSRWPGGGDVVVRVDCPILGNSHRLRVYKEIQIHGEVSLKRNVQRLVANKKFLEKQKSERTWAIRVDGLEPEFNGPYQRAGARNSMPLYVKNGTSAAIYFSAKEKEWRIVQLSDADVEKLELEDHINSLKLKFEFTQMALELACFFAVGRVEEELLEELRTEVEKSLAGFERSSKEPFLLKADWHTWPHLETFYGLVPRLGRAGTLHPAPLCCTAFAEALRRRMRRLLRDVPGRSKTAQAVQEALKTGMFAAVEAQVQTSCGEWHFMRSHRDGASGLVQLGLTLQGRRHLRLAARRTPDRAPLTGGCAGENEVDVWAEGEQADATSSISVVTVPMAEGDVYLATPAILEHGVAYEPGQQTVALMFRLALAAEAEELNRCQSDDFHQVAGHVALELQKALDQRKLHLPSLAEVIEGLRDLEGREGAVENLKILAHAPKEPKDKDDMSPPREGWERPPEIMGYVPVEDFRSALKKGSMENEASKLIEALRGTVDGEEVIFRSGRKTTLEAQWEKLSNPGMGVEATWSSAVEVSQERLMNKMGLSKCKVVETAHPYETAEHSFTKTVSIDTEGPIEVHFGQECRTYDHRTTLCVYGGGLSKALVGVGARVHVKVPTGQEQAHGTIIGRSEGGRWKVRVDKDEAEICGCFKEPLAN
ncbi:unnamed protein product [Durusdinium trenchii]|uniref:Uncharacterized protein n=1 Tax=Durusdinium trenchii TaxID=1381693 RepID=A0ABP0JMM9_9DINO